jgi:ATP-binding cassette subfamily F protein 3
MIQIDNLTKGYGSNTLLDGVSFRINSRERIGLVGRNGHGKTTLLRLMTGETAPDHGQVVIPRNYRIGIVRQHLDFTCANVREEAMTGLLPTESGHYWKVEKVLAGLGFGRREMDLPPETFSGGFQVRLNLAKVLVSEPDLLLLDEPTNYLDITSIRWIIRFLNRWPRELMVITHDRGFMDQVVTHVLGIHRRRVRKIAGGTDAYYSQIAQEEEIYENTRMRDERRRKEVQQFIARFRAKARLANLVQSRIKTLAKMEKRAKLEAVANLEFAFRYQPHAGKQVMHIADLGFGYHPERLLFGGLNLTIGTGDRVCVIGANGRGKTTLLKLLAGALAPVSGTITPHPGIVTGFYEQTNVQSLLDSRTVEEEILAAQGGTNRQLARNICGAMLFAGDDALKRVSVLSGGEKARVMLGKLVATPLNLLLLDEPSNHLDLDACDALLAALDAFQGTVVMVTHNELFLHALANKLVVFQEGSVELFTGRYQDFLDREGWREENPAKAGKPRRTHGKRPPPKAAKRINPRRKGRSKKPSAAAPPGPPTRKAEPRPKNKIDRHRLDRALRRTREALDARRIELGYLEDARTATETDGNRGRAAQLASHIAACRAVIEEGRQQIRELERRLANNGNRAGRPRKGH